MALFSVDPEICNHDGICAAICPFGLIEMKDNDNVPSPTSIAEERCMNCGHCMASCTTGAFSLRTMKPSECRAIDKNLIISREQIEHLFCARRSIRAYKDKPVPREVLNEVLRLASYAPSGHNTQITQWMVFEDAKEIKRLSGITVEWMRTVLKENPVFGKMLDADLIVNAWDRGEDYVLRGAPNLILAHGPKDYSEMHAVRENLTIAMTYLELAAFSMGLGCCWGGYFQAAVQLYPPMNEALGLPEGHISYECMMIGYPKYQYQRMPLRNEPKVIWK